MDDTLKKFQGIVDHIRQIYNSPEGIIPLHSPVFKGNEKKFLEECIDTTYVSSVGKFVEKFEDKMAEYTGSKKAIACVNGTSALYLALKLTNVNQGDEVITQPLTFIATANAITYCCAKPVFLDVDLDTMGLSPSKLEEWLSQNVVLTPQKANIVDAKRATQYSKPYNKFTGNPISACVPMHTFGHPCRIDQIVEICERFHIPVIEDAAESLGSFYKDRHTGTYGTIGVLSFNGNKIITTGGGGMLLFKDENLAGYAKHLTTQAKIPHPWEFDHNETGYNFRMPNINAALGLAQLEMLESFIISKRNIAESYRIFFRNTDIHFVPEIKNARSNYWLNCILLKNSEERDDFLKFSNEYSIMTRPAWKLMNNLAMFRNCLKGDLTNATQLASRLVNLPSSVNA